MTSTWCSRPHRDDHPDFETARAWLDRTLVDRTPFAVVDLVAGAFLRIATDRRIFSIPTPIVPNAQLAAIALEHACGLVSFDRDFARFTELDWSRPSVE